MSNKSFREGFVDGFIAPFTFLSEKPLAVDRYETNVGHAWEDVGVAFYETMRKEGIKVGAKRNQSRRVRKQAA